MNCPTSKQNKILSSESALLSVLGSVQLSNKPKAAALHMSGLEVYNRSMAQFGFGGFFSRPLFFS